MGRQSSRLTYDELDQVFCPPAAARRIIPSNVGLGAPDEAELKIRDPRRELAMASTSTPAPCSLTGRRRRSLSARHVLVPPREVVAAAEGITSAWHPADPQVRVRLSQVIDWSGRQHCASLKHVPPAGGAGSRNPPLGLRTARQANCERPAALITAGTRSTAGRRGATEAFGPVFGEIKRSVSTRRCSEAILGHGGAVGEPPSFQRVYGHATVGSRYPYHGDGAVPTRDAGRPGL